MRAGWAVVALALPAAAEARFAPPLDTELRLVSTEVREGGGVTRRFTAERRLVFRQADGGYRAELTLVGVSADAEPLVANAFAAGLEPLRGRTLRITLDPAGTIMAIADEDALIAAVADAMARRHPTSRQMAAALRVLPGAERRMLLAGELAAALAGADADLAAGSGAVEVAARSPVGAAVTLHGRRAVERDAGSVRIATDAEAALPTAEGARLTIARVRRVDAATGLLAEENETVRVGAGSERQEVTRTLTLTPVS